MRNLADALATEGAFDSMGIGNTCDLDSQRKYTVIVEAAEG